MAFALHYKFIPKILLKELKNAVLSLLNYDNKLGSCPIYTIAGA